MKCMLIFLNKKLSCWYQNIATDFKNLNAFKASRSVSCSLLLLSGQQLVHVIRKPAFQHIFPVISTSSIHKYYNSPKREVERANKILFITTLPKCNNVLNLNLNNKSLSKGKTMKNHWYGSLVAHTIPIYIKS